MKKLILLFSMLVFSISACQKIDTSDIWENINSLDERVTALEKLCREMNTNIVALQTLVKAIQEQDYITNVSPIMEGGEVVGYTISFAHNESITIYHGKDGQDGAPGQDGADGETPVIGVALDVDGTYYWTVNGMWLLDADGNKVKAAGIDGHDGSDGVSPLLKIENDSWYVSYDNGLSWTIMGQATGDQGPQGEQGVAGDSVFSDIDYTSTECVIFILADGTEIIIPSWIAFEELSAYCHHLNSNIEALHTIVSALEQNDYVVGVTPIYEDGVEIGYEIIFSQSGKVTIYHGADGKDGTDGKDGETPVIGVAKDSDGIYYWTVNGVWLLDSDGNKVKAVGTDGQDGQDGADGAPGQDGSDGADGSNGIDGKDGVTPQLKIENGLWYVSYDNGLSWTIMGQATGDQGPQGETGAQGPQGAPGVGGDSMFSDLDYSSSSDYVIFILADGTQIKVPTWSAFEALKEQCEQMNSNIEALQTIVSALQNNDYVKSVTPIYEGSDEIGYIIEFTQSGKVTIYHGADGKDGTDGKDGETPVIGVAKDTDGIYYWTVNGSWLLDSDGNKVKAVGTDGQDGQDGADGAPGKDGQDGTDGAPGQDGSDGADGSNGIDGKDGVTPQLKIENGLWYVSYDNGGNWTELGQATGDQGPQGEAGDTGPQGSAGSDGADGDSFFRSVTETDDYVSMVLADGTEIKIPKYSAVAATLALDNVTGFTATFNGEVVRNTKDLKVTVYYSTTANLTVYKNKGSVSVTEFAGNTFTLKLTGLAANTTYYFFTEVISNGTATFSEVGSFRTGEADSYVDWGEGENVGGDI